MKQTRKTTDSAGQAAPDSASDDLVNRVRTTIAHHSELVERCLDPITPLIVAASTMMVRALISGHKILLCGNGGSASCAHLFSSHLLNRYTHERPGLPAIALTADCATMTAIANDHSFTDIFSRQVMVLGYAGDILVLFSTTGNSPNLTHAVEAAHSRDMQCIALNGRDGGELATLLAGEDVNICVASESTARIREVHILVVHCLSELIDFQLLGQE
ncbi:MAG: D-sedoheptulose-7-phosphate isomerase [Acidiferrobacterales bacterium]